jgi:hypothetical protein
MGDHGNMDSEQDVGARHSRANHFSASGLFSGLTSFADVAALFKVLRGGRGA